MLSLKSLTIKNFMSIGNVTQSINFNNNDLILVLGENLDLGGNDNKNGVGKSSIVNAISYALFGTALTNIKKDNLINKSNMKHMLVTLAFELDGISYKIERGRKPAIFKFTKGDVETDASDDESQGEGRHTQEEIVRTIGFTHDMFKHILALNTYVEPFLSLKSGDQRSIIEQLLGITKLSEKAEKLSNVNKTTKDEIKEEEFRISAATEANKRIEQNIISLEKKSDMWNEAKEEKIADLQGKISNLLNVDIDAEIQNHKKKKEIDDLQVEHRTLSKEHSNTQKEIDNIERSLTRLSNVLKTSNEKICPTCNQEMDKDTHHRVHEEYEQQQKELETQLNEKKSKREEAKLLLSSVEGLIPEMPTTFYKTIDEAYQHKTILEKLGNNLENELNSKNPYVDQIESLRKDGLQEINFDKLNELVKLRDHQEFLLKLLTSKDSFIRKKIIDQNLTLLNQRLSHYITEIGLPHTVKFKSDLEVEISMYGKEFDFDNLSRGERTRLILSLSWAFRDVFESMNDKINLMFIDELIDNGLDTNGVESSLKILKKMSRDNKRNIFLISHRDELVGRVTDVLKVVKEGGFTTLESNASV